MSSKVASVASSAAEKALKGAAQWLPEPGDPLAPPVAKKSTPPRDPLTVAYTAPAPAPAPTLSPKTPKSPTPTLPPNIGEDMQHALDVVVAALGDVSDSEVAAAIHKLREIRDKLPPARKPAPVGGDKPAPVGGDKPSVSPKKSKLFEDSDDEDAPAEPKADHPLDDTGAPVSSKRMIGFRFCRSILVVRVLEELRLLWGHGRLVSADWGRLVSADWG
eukprot:CAMPEP_0175838350 /NCGR_PEP_ID=MMETSP0107_2-20121207/18201_1 /TAXON_ID=195067 ORGANISM="Goniomonas pacifica, Strain CCMP1869" /NCGR_SAMPLE_ID=MMETSP0107_2 /ASSEMBLY_ACC=CAM_ASM_000203 /LENGTH=217 /DNA_ID=CAMNT_0017151949 /DNA_START=94 /DNA_END=745 /DNA_ORIENTATION=-